MNKSQHTWQKIVSLLAAIFLLVFISFVYQVIFAQTPVPASQESQQARHNFQIPPEVLEKVLGWLQKKLSAGGSVSPEEIREFINRELKSEIEKIIRGKAGNIQIDQERIKIVVDKICESLADLAEKCLPEIQRSVNNIRSILESDLIRPMVREELARLGVTPESLRELEYSHKYEEFINRLTQAALRGGMELEMEKIKISAEITNQITEIVKRRLAEQDITPDSLGRLGFTNPNQKYDDFVNRLVKAALEGREELEIGKITVNREICNQAKTKRDEVLVQLRKQLRELGDKLRPGGPIDDLINKPQQQKSIWTWLGGLDATLDNLSALGRGIKSGLEREGALLTQLINKIESNDANLVSTTYPRSRRQVPLLEAMLFHLKRVHNALVKYHQILNELGDKVGQEEKNEVKNAIEELNKQIVDLEQKIRSGESQKLNKLLLLLRNCQITCIVRVKEVKVQERFGDRDRRFIKVDINGREVTYSIPGPFLDVETVKKRIIDVATSLGDLPGPTPEGGRCRVEDPYNLLKKLCSRR